jgi:hypothetical protein
MKKRTYLRAITEIYLRIADFILKIESYEGKIIN